MLMAARSPAFPWIARGGLWLRWWVAGTVMGVLYALLVGCELCSPQHVVPAQVALLGLVEIAGNGTGPLSTFVFQRLTRKN